MVRKELTKKQQTYEAKPNLGKNGAIDFRIQEFLPLSDRPHIEMSLENFIKGEKNWNNNH